MDEKSLANAAEILRKELAFAEEKDTVTSDDIEAWTERLVKLDASALNRADIQLRNQVYNQIWALASKHNLDFVLTEEDWESLNEMGITRSWPRYLEEMRQAAAATVDNITDPSGMLAASYGLDDEDLDVISKHDADNNEEDDMEAVDTLESELLVEEEEVQVAIPVRQLPEEAIEMYQRAMNAVIAAKDNLKGYVEDENKAAALDTLVIELNSMFGEEGHRNLDFHQISCVAKVYSEKLDKLDFKEKVQSVKYYKTEEHMHAVIRSMLNYITYFFTAGQVTHKNYLAEKIIGRPFFFQRSESDKKKESVAESRDFLKALLDVLSMQVDKLEHHVEAQQVKDNRSSNRAF
ncbi:MAG: hypothetical protein P1U61_04870 [Legionellaceae bacterium]|nr:hypothetical protein [Legionellaceae bacterium]